MTGVDLVELQLDIALGARLPLQQRHIALRGFAVQARIYAEDPSNGFRPAPSHSVDIAWPSGVRIDSAFEGAGSIPPFYDPMDRKGHSKRSDAVNRTGIIGPSFGRLELLRWNLEYRFPPTSLGDTGWCARMTFTLPSSTSTSLG